MKNVKFNALKTEKTEKYKLTTKKLDFFNSFNILKDIKSNKKKPSIKEGSQVKRNSRFNNIKKGDYISSRQKLIPKNIEQNNNNYIIGKRMKNIKPMKLLEKFVRFKIKKDFIYPYIDRLINQNKQTYKDIKIEDKPTYYNLFKINDICNNKRSRFNLNFIEISMSLNEYLIKLFHKDEYRVIMRYLLGYVFYKDEYCQIFDERYNHRKKIVYNQFMNYINNNYTLVEGENENNGLPVINNQTHNFFLLNDNLIKLSFDAERNKRDYPLFKIPNYFLIIDMPSKMIPNTIPNYYFEGNIIHNLIKKYAFYKKFNIAMELVQNSKKNNILNLEKNNHISFIANKEFNIVDNLSDKSNIKEENKLKNSSKKNVIIQNDKIKYSNKRQNLLSDIRELIEKIKVKNEDKIERLKKRTKSSRPKKKITIRKKKIIKQPYEFYEIVKNDDFYINKTEKSKILQVISDEMFNLTSLYTRSQRKHSTRMHFNPNLKIENLKTLNNDKFMRKNRYFKTNVNFNNNFKNDYISFIRSRNNRLQTFKTNFYQNEFNSFNYKTTNYDDNKNIKMKIFHNLVKQKKIRFSIKAEINKIKFKETSNFISSFNNSIKEKLTVKNLIKSIIINYQRENIEREINSLNFDKINKFNITSTSRNKSKTNTKFNKNKFKTTNYRNSNLTAKKTTFKDSFKVSDVFKHKKIYLNI